jgi:hypothetical protein
MLNKDQLESLMDSSIKLATEALPPLVCITKYTGSSSTPSLLSVLDPASHRSQAHIAVAFNSRHLHKQKTTLARGIL